MSLVKITGRVIKPPGAKAFIEDQKDFNHRLSLLGPGVYQITISSFPERLQAMKKHYFAMEAELARYLGYKKTELHEALKKKIGQKIDDESGKFVYQSITEIDNEEEMQSRIIEFQEFASAYHSYIFRPFDPLKT